MSVRQISRILGVRKDIGSAILESMRKQGKLELFEVGRSKVYTLPKDNKPIAENNELNDSKIRTIGIVSGKGGTGKTTVTLNLAGALMTLNQNVVSVDGDVNMSGLGLQLGMYYFPTTLHDVVKGNSNILEALHIHSTGLRIIPSSLKVEDLDLSCLQGMFQKLNDNSLVLIDSSPGLGKNSIQIMKSCREIIIVSNPEFQSLTNAIKVIDQAKDLGVKSLGLILNRYSKRGYQTKILNDIENICEIPLLGIIPEDKRIQESIFNKTPNIFVHPYSQSSITFKQIAAKISDASYNPPKFPFLKKIWRRMS
jgi:septum site-determining protein MinD